MAHCISNTALALLGLTCTLAGCQSAVVLAPPGGAPAGARVVVVPGAKPPALAVKGSGGVAPPPPPNGPVLDTYGGLTGVALTNTSGYFRTQKVGERWVFVDPLGHPYWFLGVADVDLNTESAAGLTYVNQKYGNSNSAWGLHTVQRLKSWGFNAASEYASAYVVPVNNFGSYETTDPMPWLDLINPAVYSLVNSGNYAAGPVKNLINGLDSEYTNYRGAGFPDVYDPNFSAWVNNELAANTSAAEAASPWLIGTVVGDLDNLFGFGQGPDLPAGRAAQTNLGWVALCTNPQQAAAPGVVYGGAEVYTKQALANWLQSKYGTIAALNTAWGSNYTTFGSSGTQYNGETLFAGNGSLTTLTHTLAHATAEPNSVQVLVNGYVVGGDEGNGSGAGQSAGWVATSWQSSSAYAAGRTIQAGNAIFAATTGGVAGETQPTWPAAPGATVTDGTVVWTNESPAITAFSVNYTTGVLSLTFASAPAASESYAANYWVNGYGVGTGLLDEDGRNAWVGNDDAGLSKANAAVAADLNTFLGMLADQFFSTISTALRKYRPNQLVFGPASLNGWNGVSRAQVLAAAGQYCDVVMAGMYDQAVYDFTLKAMGDHPVVVGMGSAANPDSDLSAYPNPDSPGYVFNTQAQRGAAYQSSVEGDFAYTGTAAAGSLQGSSNIIGSSFWAWEDSNGEETNWGLVSFLDNPYDGVSAVIAAGTDAWGYPTGGEAANYGNFVGPVTTTNNTVLSDLLAALGGH